MKTGYHIDQEGKEALARACSPAAKEVTHYVKLETNDQFCLWAVDASTVSLGRIVTRIEFMTGQRCIAVEPRVGG